MSVSIFGNLEDLMEILPESKILLSNKNFLTNLLVVVVFLNINP